MKQFKWKENRCNISMTCKWMKTLKAINNILTKSLVFEPLLNINGYTFSSNHLTSAGPYKYKHLLQRKST